MTVQHASTTLSRSRLHRVLSAALSVRLTTVTAPAGYGKTTLLAGWAACTPAAWQAFSADDGALRPALDKVVTALRAALPGMQWELPAAAGDVELAGAAEQGARAYAVAALLCEAVTAAAPDSLLLILDDVHLIRPQSPAAQLLESLCRQLPANVHLVLSSRQPPPFAVQRLRVAGELVEVNAAQLGFTEQETAALLAERLGAGSPPPPDERLGTGSPPPPAELAALVHRTTGGWPIAVRLAVEALRNGAEMDPQAALDALHEPGSLFDYLADEIFDREPVGTRELVRTAALFDRFTPELLTALGHPDAPEVMVDLVGRGLFVERLRATTGWYALMPLAREFVTTRFPPDDSLRWASYERAAQWFTEQGHLGAAVAALARLGAYPRIERLLADRSGDLLTHDGADAVVAVVEQVPADRRSPRTWELAGEAHQVRGDWGRAMDCLQRAAGPGGRLTPALARRMAWMHHLSGAPAEALAVATRCELDGTDPVAESLLLSCMASAQWAGGDLAASETSARAAMRLALACGDDAACGAAHTVLAMVAAATGDRTRVAAHYGHALAHAEQAGDVLGMIRIRVNRSSHYAEEGCYREALAEVEAALPLADVTGFATYRALGLNNRGEARLGLGQLDEAAADFRAARDIFATTGSWLAALAHGHLAEIHQLRGDRVLARVAYEEAIRLAEVNNTVPQLVPALAGLARLLVAERPAAAADLVQRALACGTGFGYSSALLAAATVALADNDRESALVLAVRAEHVAGERGDRAALAESLQLQARAVSEPEAARRLLDQAVRTWREIGNPLGEVASTVARARMLGGAGGAQLATAAAQSARRIGAGALAEEATAVAEECARSGRPPVTIQTLGGFRVLRHGEPVPAVAWQSKKARDLVKILIARRGRPVTRDALVGLLWPDEDPEKVGNRLSVALSTARSVLDPHRRAGGEPCIVTDCDTVRLDASLVAVDVLLFLTDAQAGLAAWRLRQADASPLLAAAEAAYHGDFLEEDPYGDWAVPLREEARLTYLQVAAALAEHCEDAGEPVTASRYCLRILERDCYDESAHLALLRVLVAAGSHGEARRRYQSYVVRMAEIGVEPRPFPAAYPPLRPDRSPGAGPAGSPRAGGQRIGGAATPAHAGATARGTRR